MIKRKFLDRANWSRVIDKGFKSDYINSEEFSGNISLVFINKVREPLFIDTLGKKYCLADDGYSWLQQLPNKGNYCITTMFDNKGEIVQWYFDIIKGQGINENAVAYFDDLFLDVVVLPQGEILLLDEDELEEALKNNEITQKEYNLAYEAANKIIKTIASDISKLTILSKKHFQYLIEQDNKL